MRIGVKVGDVMTRNFISVKPDMSVIDCAREIIKKHVGSLIVKEDQHLKGIITEKDIIWVLVKRQDLNKIKAKDIMTKRVVGINPSKDLYDALLRMRNKKTRVLPVMVKDHVIGVLTIKDILRVEPSLFDIALETMSIREETEKLKRRHAVLSGEESWIKEGECPECGAYGMLYNSDGRLICEACSSLE